jgi:hypothetical protein
VKPYYQDDQVTLYRIDRRVNMGSQQAARNKLAIPFESRLRVGITISDSGCWLWTGYAYSNGYAAMSWQGKQQLLHRLAYEHYVGPIPDGLQLDHLCRVRSCVNPDHLEPVTAMENTRRAMRLSCVNGHPFTPDNTYIPTDGKRYCRECRRRRVREYRQRRQESK